MTDHSTIKVWTAQADIVVETLRQTGIYQVRRRFIQQKYGELAPLFLTAYDWFVQQYARRIPPPPGAEYGIWVYTDPRGIANYGPGDSILELEVPADQLVLMDQTKWNRILNLTYLPQDPADNARFHEELARQGITQAHKAVSTNFYPLLKREIIASWDRLFNGEPIEPIHQFSALWEIRREWITRISGPSDNGSLPNAEHP